MKKKYSMPDTAITNIELQQMIAVSNPEDGFSKSTPKELEGGISGGNMSRSNSIWDDEEEY